MVKKECIAMLLAGGQGSRLCALTKKAAKPAIPFGGKYRIIDFPLSNCANSGITTVGVLTQYEPHELNSYIGTGQPWDLDRLNGGVTILPPYQQSGSTEWYKGTADAIFRNMAFIESFGPEYVLVLSGDHIYKMDYSVMLDFHKRKRADCTIAVLDVPPEEASRFGILTVNGDSFITRFDEKPENPQSTLASMGIYIFEWKKLREYLIRDSEDKTSKNDFGANVIPAMLSAGERMAAYPFSGYWKDVGTIDSLWEANMDLLAPGSLDLYDPDWKIYARTRSAPSHYVAPGAAVSHSLVCEGCEIEGRVEQSILMPGVRVGKGALVRYAVLMPDVTVEAEATVEYAIVAERARIREKAHVGQGPMDITEGEWGIAVVADDMVVGKGACVGAKQIVDFDEPCCKKGEGR